MDFELHLLAVPFACMTLCLAIGASLALFPRRAVAGVSPWLWWVWAYVLGNLLFAFRSPRFEPVAVPLRNALWILAVGSLWLGCARYSGQRAKAWPIGAVLMIVCPIQAYFTCFSPNAAHRIVLLSATLALGYGATAQTFYRSDHPAPPGLRWAAMGLFIGAVLFYIGKMVYGLLWASRYAQNIDTLATLVTWIFILLSQTVLSLLFWFLADRWKPVRT